VSGHEGGGGKGLPVGWTGTGSRCASKQEGPARFMRGKHERATGIRGARGEGARGPGPITSVVTWGGGSYPVPEGKCRC
jgi:hypothetical protein